MYKIGFSISRILQGLCLVWVFAGFASAQERTWTVYTPQTRSWKILSPGNMLPDTEAVKLKSNKGSYSYTDYNGFFAVVYRDTPRRYVPWKPDYSNYFKKIVKDAVRAAKGELISNDEFDNGTFKGREVRIKVPNTQVISREAIVKKTYRIERFRMFFHDKRFYLILAVLPEDQIEAPEVNKYLDSFTVLEEDS